MVCQWRAEEKAVGIGAKTSNREKQRDDSADAEQGRDQRENIVELILRIAVERHLHFLGKLSANRVQRRFTDLRGKTPEQIRREPEAQGEPEKIGGEQDTSQPVPPPAGAHPIEQNRTPAGESMPASAPAARGRKCRRCGLFCRRHS
jgi:hypothetical protein